MKEIKAWALIDPHGRLVERDYCGPLIWLKKKEAKEDADKGERVVRVTVRIEE